MNIKKNHQLAILGSKPKNVGQVKYAVIAPARVCCSVLVVVESSCNFGGGYIDPTFSVRVSFSFRETRNFRTNHCMASEASAVSESRFVRACVCACILPRVSPT
jgi:hypothetical protein